MKRILLLSTAMLMMISALVMPGVHAQDATGQACINDMYLTLRKEQLFFRSIYLGQKAAAQLARGSVRFDGSGNSWIKTADDEWKSYSQGSSSSRMTNESMDKQAYPPKRVGLLEEQKATTSELIPPLLQATRAFQCRLRYVCALVLQSRGDLYGDTFDVEIDGCVKVTNARRVNSCKDYEPAAGTSVDNTGLNVQVGVCDQAADIMLKQEEATLHTIISYDASYRSFLQFAGIVQGFSDGLKGPVLDVLTDTVRTLQQFGNTPCFGSQCDE